MGSALLDQWSAVAARKFPDYTFLVIDPAAEPGARGDQITFVPAAPPADRCQFDLLIVAVKPQMINAVLPEYRSRLAEGACVASIAAGYSIARLHSLIGHVPVVRIMPNLPAVIGAGVSGLCADPAASEAQRDAVEALMSATGVTMWVDDEDRLDRLTAIAGSGPGYVFEIARSYVQAAENLGFSPENARKLVLGTIVGTAAMAQSSDEALATLRSSVTSKDGTTAAGLAALNDDGGLDARMNATLEAAYNRAVELR